MVYPLTSQDTAENISSFRSIEWMNESKELLPYNEIKVIVVGNSIKFIDLLY